MDAHIFLPYFCTEINVAIWGRTLRYDCYKKVFHRLDNNHMVFSETTLSTNFIFSYENDQFLSYNNELRACEKMNKHFRISFSIINSSWTMQCLEQKKNNAHNPEFL